MTTYDLDNLIGLSNYHFPLGTKNLITINNTTTNIMIYIIIIDNAAINRSHTITHNIVAIDHNITINNTSSIDVEYVRVDPFMNKPTGVKAEDTPANEGN